MSRFYEGGQIIINVMYFITNFTSKIFLDWTTKQRIPAKI